MTHTAQDLLEAVGVDWKFQYGVIVCPECGWNRKISTHDKSLYHHSTCRRPSTRDVEPTYTGPALGTPELDAVLWVEGQRWFYNRDHATKRAVAKNLAGHGFEENDGGWVSGRLGLLFQQHNPGHALAAAIKEVTG
jgi:hypothetical protein